MTMKTIKGPAIFLAQFAGDQAPFNSLDGIAKWASDLGYKAVQIPTWDSRLIDLEKAAEIYVRHLVKLDKTRITEAVSILEKVTNSQLNSTFAKVCVAAQRYEEAAAAYERANDVDKVVEIMLRHLDQVQQAFDLVRDSSSTEGGADASKSKSTVPAKRTMT